MTGSTNKTLIDISIVTPTFNRAQLLGRLWNSMKDAAARFEWIVVDDGSSDSTANVVRSFNDDRIHYIRHENNRGVGAARNNGARVSRGKYIVFIDSDDEFYEGALPDMVRTMDNADAAVGVAAFLCIDAATGKARQHLKDGLILCEFEVVCKNELRSDWILVFRREVLDTFKLEEDIQGCENVFVFAISKRYAFIIVERPGSLVHFQRDSLSNVQSLITRSFDIAISFERILKNHKEVLEGCPEARAFYTMKALYRYAVAGFRTDAWRMFRLLLECGRIKDIIRGCAVMLLGLSGAAKIVETIRIPMIQKVKIASNQRCI